MNVSLLLAAMLLLPAAPSAPASVLVVVGPAAGAEEVALLEAAVKAVGDASVEVARDPGTALRPEALERVQAVVLTAGAAAGLPAGSGEALAGWIEKGGGVVEIGCALEAAGGAVLEESSVPGPLGITLHDLRHPAALPVRPYWKVADGVGCVKGLDPARVRVLLSVDMWSVPAGKRRPVHVPVAWTRSPGKGRVLHTSLGAEPAAWKDALLREHLTGAVAWVLRRKGGESAPNPEVSAEMQKLAERAAAPAGEPRKPKG
ncbi:MAG: ThuA domain-containing protein [Planctomycetes bacterium]|nr:ThuA domain-containing protein [Planctomycetota bacterium]